MKVNEITWEQIYAFQSKVSYAVEKSLQEFLETIGETEEYLQDNCRKTIKSYEIGYTIEIDTGDSYESLIRVEYSNSIESISVKIHEDWRGKYGGQ